MTDLQKLAAVMIAVVDRTTATARHHLSDGLTLTLIRRGNTRPPARQLSLTRILDYPGDEEETVIRAAFAVPDSATRSQMMIEGYGVIRLTWFEPPPPVAVQAGFGGEVEKGENYYAA